MKKIGSKKKLTIILSITLCLIVSIGGITCYASNTNRNGSQKNLSFWRIFDIFHIWDNSEDYDDYDDSSSESYWDTRKYRPDNSDNSGGDSVISTTTTPPSENPTTSPDIDASKSPKVTSTPEVSSTPASTDEPAEIGKVYSGPGKESSAFYKPRDNANMDYNNSSSRYCFSRSRESDHFYVFWEPGFGDNPNANTVPEKLRVDMDDLLAKAELFYYVNVNKLHMSDGKLLNGYKMQIYLLYQEEWLATGSGYDEKIGALWVNPSTCQPVGSTIAHEIGHSFQYMIASKQLADGKSKIGETGFRYGYPGSKGGCAFWEVCAQYQAYNVYPEESFTWYHMDTWFANYNCSLENELCRYQNYWWLFYVSEKNDLNVLQRLWNESKYPEDALSTYLRVYLNNDINKFNDQMYEYAAKATTFDFNAIKQYSNNYQGRYNTTLYPMGDGYSQVAYANCPEANGFNAIKLDASAGKKVTIDFKGLSAGSNLAANDPGKYIVNTEATGTTRTYNSYSGTNGWRYGFVALLNDGTRVYSDSYAQSKGTVSFDIPNGTKYVYFVVLGAPNEYVCHPWDDTEINDVQMPYAVKISYQ